MVKTNLPVILLRGVVILPHNEIRIEFKDEIDKELLKQAERNHDNHLLLTSLVNPLEESPNIEDLPKIAILGKIKSKIELPNGTIRTVIAGLDRVEVLNYIKIDKKVECFAIPTRQYQIDELEENALKRILFRDLELYIENASYMSNNVLGRILGITSLSILSDIISFELPLSYNNKIKYIEEINPLERTKKLIEDLNHELEVLKLEIEIDENLNKALDKDQKEYILREKIKIIKDELGESDSKDNDVEELKLRIADLDAPAYIKEKLNKELKKYEFTSLSSPEINIIRNYIELLLELPWNVSSVDNKDLKEIRNSLDESHFGLEKVKTRIVEYMAVMRNAASLNSPIICLVGPPGTGKTTLAKSIALALNKKFVKMSVGGIRDEAEIIGHRRTYIGASPGKIIKSINKAGVNNPLFLIDEVDKMVKDYRGDPASSLLDVLDKEQNSMFIDNYVEEEFDLSKVMFILTANSETDIPDALRDRLEIIELSSYTELEKFDIAKNYLLPKLLKEHNLTPSDIEIKDESIREIISGYTKEAGVRELSRQIETIFRKVVTKILELREKSKYIIDTNNLKDYLGTVKYMNNSNEKEKNIGIVNGLAYTPIGGSILKISSTYFKGDGKLTLTGNLGDVIKESANIAYSYLKANYKKFKIDFELLTNNDIHLHYESGAIPKDGPSAGVTAMTSLISLFTNTVVDSSIAMTGEITLRGKILPIGGLKEKLVAAYNNKIKTVFIPLENKNDLDDIPNYVKNKLDIKLVDNYMEIYKEIWEDKKS